MLGGFLTQVSGLLGDVLVGVVSAGDQKGGKCSRKKRGCFVSIWGLGGSRGEKGVFFWLLGGGGGRV